MKKPPPNPEPEHHHHDGHGPHPEPPLCHTATVVFLLEQILLELRVIIEALSAPPAPGTLGISVTSVKGKWSSTMAVLPVAPLTLSDVEKVQLSLAPKLPDGSTDPGPFAWSSDNPAVAQVVGVNADGSSNDTDTNPTGPVVWVLTPTATGNAVVTVNSASANVDGNSIALTITEGRTGNVNLSAGLPVSDLPTPAAKAWTKPA